MWYACVAFAVTFSAVSLAFPLAWIESSESLPEKMRNTAAILLFLGMGALSLFETVWFAVAWWYEGFWSTIFVAVAGTLAFGFAQLVPLCVAYATSALSNVSERQTPASTTLMRNITPIRAAIAGLAALCLVLVVAIVVALSNGASRTAGWETIATGLCDFRCPPSMELRRGEAMKGLATAVHNQFGVTPAPPTVLQPKGNDSFELDSFENYSRVLVSGERMVLGSFPKQSEVKGLSATDLNEFGVEFRKIIESQLSVYNAKAPDKPVAITRWHSTKVATIGNRTAIVFNFERTMGSNAPVTVWTYLVFDDDRKHEITLSYRSTESDIWKKDFEAMLATFRFNQ